MYKIDIARYSSSIYVYIIHQTKKKHPKHMGKVGKAESIRTT